ncbi:MAG: hypothetical protein JRE24_10580 [Deltaproteobacteria bacterium]|nr:hypothetical protein [Deltaproteobacteria bacterium]
MSHDIEHDVGGGGILANKTPKSVTTVVEEYGFAKKMIEWEIAHDVKGAANKTMMVLGIIPMAVIFFATEAIPIGLTGVLMPVLA